MNKNEGCEHIASILEDLLAKQMEIASKLFGLLFDDEDHYDVLVFQLNGSQEEQIQLLMDFHENEKIPELKPDALMQKLWDILVLESEITAHSFLIARVAILVCVLLGYESYYLVCHNDAANSLLAYGQSSMMLGTGMVMGGAYFRKDSMGSNARRAAEAKLAADPKQKDKAMGA